MKISELIQVLKARQQDYGDIEVEGIGHPGECGCAITEDNVVINEPKPDEDKILFLVF